MKNGNVRFIRVRGRNVPINIGESRLTGLDSYGKGRKPKEVVAKPTTTTKRTALSKVHAVASSKAVTRSLFGIGVATSAVGHYSHALSKKATVAAAGMVNRGMQHFTKAEIARLAQNPAKVARHVRAGKLLVKQSSATLKLAKGLSYMSKNRRAFMLGGFGVSVLGYALSKTAKKQ